MSRGRTTIATHLILTGYGHWVANDIRGSGSSELRDPRFAELGAIHQGRKRVQPPRRELREFYAQVDPLLTHERIWFDPACREAVAAAFGATVARRGYTCWACGVCSNHAHLVVRTHRDRGDVMWQAFADDARDALRGAGLIAAEHPLWSERPYKVFLYSPDEVWERIDYAEKNPEKEGLPRQVWPFVVAYDGWPLHNGKSRG
jgi:hypothetical protein